MNINIRLAQAAEISALEQLIVRSVRGLSVGYYTPEQIESAIRYVFGVDTQLIADGTYFVAEVEGVLAGCGGWSKRKTLYGGDKVKETEDPLLDPAHEPARIRAFFVDPAFARRGVGRQIIATCEEAAQAAGFTRLELAATLPGVPLYAAVGYQAIERLEVPMPDGVLVPIVRMGKQLGA